MPHGTPDWGLVGPKQTIFGLDDLGEHAVRLGSPHFFDRRGDALLLTTFQEGTGPFSYLAAGAGTAVQLYTHHSRQGAYSVRLMSGTDDGAYSGIRARMAYPVPSSLGLEFCFIGQGVQIWRAYLEWYDGDDHYFARIRITESTGAIDYGHGDGLWTNFATLGLLYGGDNPIHTLKLVADMPLSEYVRVIFNNNSWSLAGTPVPSIPAAVVGEHLVVEIHYAEANRLNTQGYVDNVIVTQNEP